MVSHALRPIVLILKGLPIFWKLPGLGISNMNLLIADVKKSVSGTKITFPQGGGAKIKSKQFSEFAPRNTGICTSKKHGTSKHT